MMNSYPTELDLATDSSLAINRKSTSKLPTGSQPPTILLHLLWPGLLSICLGIYWLGLQMGYPIIAFNLAYFGMALALFWLERWLPYEQSWLPPDGQAFNDIGHTALTKGLSQLLATTATIIGVAHMGPDTASGLWPSTWPLLLQITLALVIAEFGLYWAHRIAHEWWPAWCWHAVHHSVTKLWFINTGRFHLLDSLWKMSFALLLGLAAGAPKQIILWVLVITPLIGFLTHCNVRMECRCLSYIFNTPQLHRWHHSRDPVEGNRNYGENLMLWDLLFGTHYLPSQRRPSADIGCSDPVPRHFIGQIQYPFQAWLSTKWLKTKLKPDNLSNTD